MKQPSPSETRGQRKRHAGGNEVLQRRLRERPARQARQVRQSVLGGLHRRHERHLVLRAPAGLAAALLPSEVGVVDLHAAAELSVGFGQPHGLQELVLDQPCGAIAHAELALEFSAETLFLDWVRSCMAMNQRVNGSLVASKTVPLMALH